MAHDKVGAWSETFFAFISFTNFLILDFLFPYGDCIKSGAVAGGFSGDFSGFDSQVNKGGGDKIASSNPSLSVFVSGTFFLLDENNKFNKPLFFGFSTVLKFMLFDLMVSSDINVLFELRMPDGELNTS